LTFWRFTNRIIIIIINAFKARLDKFWQHQAVKFDVTVEMISTENRLEEVIK